MIRTLVVDDDPAAAKAHGLYVERISGFALAGVALSGTECLEWALAGDVDLLILDIRMPDVSGLEVLQELAAQGKMIDTIIVSSVRDMDMVYEAMRLGVMHYLLKPFTFSMFRAKLEDYTGFRKAVSEFDKAVSQEEIDALFRALRPTSLPSLPKCLAPDTLRLVVNHLCDGGAALTAQEAGQLAGISRVSARRYLEYLVANGQAVRELLHDGRAGRPIVRYRWGTRSSWIDGLASQSG